MLWAIFREYQPGTAEIRAAHLASHRNFLQTHASILLLSGALQSDDGMEGTGSLLVVKVGSRAEAQAFVDSDPLMQAGVFARVNLTRLRKGQFNPAVAEGE